MQQRVCVCARVRVRACVRACVRARAASGPYGEAGGRGDGATGEVPGRHGNSRLDSVHHRLNLPSPCQERTRPPRRVRRGGEYLQGGFPGGQRTPVVCAEREEALRRATRSAPGSLPKGSAMRSCLLHCRRGPGKTMCHARSDGTGRRRRFPADVVPRRLDMRRPQKAPVTGGTPPAFLVAMRHARKMGGRETAQ